MTEFKEFTLNELFDKIPTKTIPYKKSELPTIPNDYYNIPAVSAGIKDKGASVYVHDADCTILENYISIAANGNSGMSFFQNRKFTILQDSYAIKWSLTDDIPNQNQYLYLLALLRKLLVGNFGWVNKAGWNHIKDLVISIPVSAANPGTPDWDYMDKYIQQIQQKYIEQKQVAYQKRVQTFDETVGTNLSDTEVDSILKRYHDAEFSEFRIGELFEWQKNIEIDPIDVTQYAINSNIKYPFIGQSVLNHGIIKQVCLPSNYLNNTDSNMTILIHSNNSNIEFMNTPFYLKNGHNATSILQNSNLNRLNTMYFLAAIDKAINNKYSYNHKATKSALKSTNILLPALSSNLPDYVLMEDYIKVIQQKYVRNLEAQLHERIDIAKQLI